MLKFKILALNKSVTEKFDLEKEFNLNLHNLRIILTNTNGKLGLLCASIVTSGDKGIFVNRADEIGGAIKVNLRLGDA